MMPDRETPASLAYRWPAEWERHASTWLAWPHNQNTWPGKFEQIPPLYAEFVRTLARFEPVNVLAGGKAVMAQARALVGDLENVAFHEIETNDAWTRDHGPTFLAGHSGQELALVDWQYNAWGGKYPPFDKDNAVPRQIAQKLGRRCFSPPFVLEGGAVDGNGQGTVLTTEACLLNPNRNPGATRSDVETFLADYLGARNVLWLGDGEIAGDDTDGHVDQLARFVNPTTVVAAVEHDTNDPNHAPLAHNFDRLAAMTDQDGRPLNVVPLPMPRPLYHEGQRVPASYLNLYIANGGVIVPVFDDPHDEPVLDALAKLFPKRRICGLSAIDLVWGLGAFHCLTQQEPALDLDSTDPR